ncbi:MAG: hypothetical protein A2268_16555 [Candidatus Raymondbacteria bacterium RifOxyA12_full_50_37]|uniref:Peptidase M24 domain-containing protein n=1 Tax=Candidatus Raymondbacteria bacterium RIFOXYD12_FULL_49_13 TaxID=1817890 RepID=A0A1F7F4A2_UNCRA|nr:MAG: hypothetical protein A2268_16555 [Candidatus Raymondbacteria bacterium RifOxyA12_full_50_37]OGJ86222.1 MAG: hypothetical protein A2248_16145 [Candidatus Raymondbacteria bacterium RIFOXYA2_FULL_49_16]OGJ95760.1 MAG: hypothetical protein A2453_11465 [Candidatus Raymondbacteria bacterium RIFOXYC2_FULL_50_21]OGJ95980.1 MAG: hypothetical protein A2350_15875 [Candidatus Raymondbacteria bacterium RifOxyB12_full_50_8]OGK01479.1 MAG: hypothetical protein A2519_19340 [Candidatus Raymondbacteria b
MDIAVKRRNRELFARAKERIQKSRKGSLDIIYITHHESAGADRSFFFFTGIAQGNLIYASCVVSRDGSVHLFIHELEEAEALQTGLPYTIIKLGEQTVIKALQGSKYVGINANAITLQESGAIKEKRFQLVNINKEIEDARASKSQAEIERMRQSAAIAAKVAAAIPGMARPHMTEKELAALIDFEMACAGSERPAFDTIVAFGENSAVPHAQPSGRKLKSGDFILCDFGATAGKMCSDITRVYCAGKPSAQQQAMYQAVYKVQRDALARLKAGANGNELHTAAEAAIDEFFRTAKLRGKMGHGLGHSIGLYPHDGKRIGRTDFLVPENFVTTIEPAGYAPGFGGVRIEDTVLVTREGIEVLTEKAPKKDLVCVAGCEI